MGISKESRSACLDALCLDGSHTLEQGEFEILFAVHVPILHSSPSPGVFVLQSFNNSGHPVFMEPHPQPKNSAEFRSWDGDKTGLTSNPGA